MLAGPRGEGEGGLAICEGFGVCNSKTKPKKGERGGEGRGGERGVLYRLKISAQSQSNQPID